MLKVDHLAVPQILATQVLPSLLSPLASQLGLVHHPSHLFLVDHVVLEYMEGRKVLLLLHC